MAAATRTNAARKRAGAALQLRRQSAAAGLTSELAGIAREFGATEFALFLIQADAAQCHLRPVLDSESPRTSRTSRRLANRPLEGANCRLRHSTRPFWWRRGAGPAPLVLFLADKDNLLGLDGTGIALPLHAGPGRNGLVLFAGDAMRIADDALLDAHLRCLRLFEQADRLQPGASRNRLAMSNRELDCLRLTADGKTSEEIGRLLGLSRHTTDQYLNSACQKLNAVNRTQAVSKAMRTGLIG
jgi:DNA-binding CsgD family transcriptional regulator